jgi:hypothetical protein
MRSATCRTTHAAWQPVRKRRDGLQLHSSAHVQPDPTGPLSMRSYTYAGQTHSLPRLGRHLSQIRR